MRKRHLISKPAFPVGDARQILESGPIVLVSSFHEGASNLMTMGWHMMMEFSPSLFGCIIAGSNHSFSLIRASRECVINVPTVDLKKEVVGIGNCSGNRVDKWNRFGLTQIASRDVQAPMVGECFASFECRLSDDSLIDRYNMFIFEIVAAHVARKPKFRKTMHYHGDGRFTIPGQSLTMARAFKRQNL